MSADLKDPSAQTGGGLLTRLGNVSCPDERSYWCFGHSRAEFEAAAELIDAVAARYPRLGILLTAPQPATRAWLRERFPRAQVLPPPLPLRLFCDRYLVNMNVRGAMILGRVGSAERSLLRGANARAIPVVVSETPAGDVPAAAALGAGPETVEHHFVARPAAGDALRAAGVDAGRITLLPQAGAARVDAFMAVTVRLLAQDLKLIRSTQRPLRRLLERLGLHCMGDPGLRRLLAAKARRYDSLEDLRAALGNPGSILCLGNGPSSEDPAVAQVAHDCLFRVNDLWLKRGLLTRPDMVFTGSKGTLALVKDAIFGLHTVRSEARLLVAPLLRPARWGFRYATIERFGLFISDPKWDDMRPTNGAIMLATAVALQPARLTVSGIDLFSHPAGTYPGDTRTPNAYTPGHNAESELALLLEALSRYRGELTILSPALQARWDEYRRARPGAAPDARGEAR
ncbi:MAG: hypothetical protein Kow00114_10160 [Kiloniellaceae bacterium]